MGKKERECESSRPCQEEAPPVDEKTEGHGGALNILDIVAANTERRNRVDGIVIGRLSGFDATGSPLVDFNLNALGSPIPARAVLALSEKDFGRDVALMFESSDSQRPIIIGLMHANRNPVEVDVDGGRCVIEAEKEVLIRCGKSSIHLKENGEIEINGRDIMSRASRNHRIRGGSIHLN